MRCFGVIGGDRRQGELARLLEQDGHQVVTFGLELWRGSGADLAEAAKADCILLPLPLCKKQDLLNTTGETVTTAEVFDLLWPEQLILAGQVKPAQRAEAESRGLQVIDYLAREELAVANAIPTAEGAIQIAMEQLPVTICGAEVLVLGFGRIGKLLAHRLLGLGAQVTVAARKHKDRVWAESLGCKTLHPGKLAGQLGGFQAVFNTVPTLLLDGRLLAQLREDCLCIDLASQDGLDYDAADQLHIRAMRARGLPGKVAPITAAMAIRDTIYHILEERSELT